MAMRCVCAKWFLLVTILLGISFSHVSAACELSFSLKNRLYIFNLTSPIPKYPHGVLSEDGFYKVAVNETLLWFQLCDGMIFNHDPPRCFDCRDCGGPSHCGMKCSAVMANNLGGYYVCTTIGQASNTGINLIDEMNPEKGVVVKMSNIGAKINCSLSVSVLCDSNGVQGPYSSQNLGSCDYATVLRHPSGCAKIISVHGKGWGWFGTLITIILFLLVGYLLAGSAYRYYSLGIRGVNVVPNLEFWISLPQRTLSALGSLVRRFRRPSQNHRSSYSPVNF